MSTILPQRFFTFNSMSLHLSKSTSSVKFLARNVGKLIQFLLFKEFVFY
eukprot:UN26581